jgi:hypothetical protein
VDAYGAAHESDADLETPDGRAGLSVPPGTSPAEAVRTGAVSRKALAARPGLGRSLAGALGNRATARALARQAVPIAPVPPLHLGAATATEVQTIVGTDFTGGGQFAFTAAISNVIWSELDRLQPLATDASLDSAFRDAVNHVAVADLTVLRAACQQSSDPLAGDYRKLIGPETASARTMGGQVVAELWGRAKTPGAGMPGLAAVRTLNHMRGVRAWEMSACFTTTQRYGKKLSEGLKGIHSAPRRREKRMPPTQLMDRVRRSDHKADEVNLRAAVPVRGDEAVYNKNLDAAVDKMKDALVDGWVLHVRVISGVWLDLAGKGTPNEEHSLLIYDSAPMMTGTGTEFFCFDPDLNSNTATPNATSANAPAGAKAFQSIFFDPAVPRLSTAPTDAEFPVVDFAGHHANKTHRYQVVRVFTVEDV